MNSIFQEQLNKAIELHKQLRLDEAEVIYNRILNVLPFEESVLYCLSDLYLRKDRDGLAINLLSNLLQTNPNHADAWCNIGCAFRKQNDLERAKAAWNRALQVGGETAVVCGNFATLYADNAKPEMALVWLDKSLKLDPENSKVLWSKALALLTMGNWKEGWELYEARQKGETWDSRQGVDAPIWDGSPIEHLYLHGEQGVGDEIMFMSAIPKLLESGKVKEITLEVNPKVAGVAKQTFQQFKVVKEETPGRYDAKLPIGSLMRMFGPNNKPFLKPHPERVAHYRRELEKLGKGPYIALTWTGGMVKTRVHDRSFSLKLLEPIMRQFCCVSAQYTHDNPYIEEERKQYELPAINEESTGGDLHDQAALLKAVDAVVTVQQTAVHVAGGVGAKTFAMIGDKPHWRYGLKGDSLPWYGSVKMIRKTEDWEGVVRRTLDELNHSGIQVSEREAA